MSEQMNRTMLVLSIVAAIFLSLGLLTGLLGINVGGIPGTEWKGSFWVVVALMGALTVFEIWLFRRLGLIHSPRKK
jgi:zinc transporter